MARIASRRGAGGSGGGNSIVPMLVRNRHFLFASFLVLVALAAFAIMDDPAVTLISAGILDAIEENATAVDSSSAAAGAAGGSGGLHSVRGAASARGSTDTATDTDAEANDEATDAVHKVAGLSCTAYGGPPDEVAAEMVYWRDIPQDAAYVSPYKSYGPQKKYLTFEPDEGGWNNIRMSMETAVAFAHAMGRTLVMPPEQKMYLLEKKEGNSKNTFSFSDFFHFESVAVEHPGVEVISTQEFLEREILSGNIRHPQTGEILIPPSNKTDWEGIGTYHSEEFKELAKFLRSVGTTSTWACDQCVATFPSQPGPFTSERLETMLKDILAEGDSRASEVFDNNPTPVDAPAKDRMKEMLAHRENLCIYNNTLQSAPVMHFLGGGEYRLLVHFYAFMFFEDYLQDLWTKRFVRDHLRYVDEIQCAAARVVAAVRKKARSNGAADDAFDTFHIRRGDFQYKDTRIEADEIYDNVKHLLKENSTIYIATDEKNATFFDPLRRHYNLYFLQDFEEEIGDINKNFYGMMDQRIASRGRNFFGTYYSTFSGYITRMRGYHSQAESEDAVKAGQSSSYYFVPKHFVDSVQRYKSVQGPFWAREFPVSWRDIDRGVDELSKTGGKMFVAAAR